MLVRYSSEAIGTRCVYTSLLYTFYTLLLPHICIHVVLCGGSGVECTAIATSMVHLTQRTLA